MMNPTRLLIFPVIAFLAGRPAQAADSAPPLPILIERVVAKDDANQKALKTVEYSETLRTDQLDAQDKITKRQELKMIIDPGAAQEVRVVSAKGDDLPSDPDEAVRQVKGKEAQRTKINFALKDMAGRFNIHLMGPGDFEGQSAWIVAFEPKPDEPYRDQTEKVLNHLRGRMWISMRDYSVLRTEAALAEPVDIAWIFVQINSLNFHYELRNTTGGLGPASIQTTVQVDAPFITFRQRMTVEMTDFHPRAKVAQDER